MRAVSGACSLENDGGSGSGKSRLDSPVVEWQALHGRSAYYSNMRQSRGQ